jgi:hypothetical protein
MHILCPQAFILSFWVKECKSLKNNIEKRITDTINCIKKLDASGHPFGFFVPQTCS